MLQEIVLNILLLSYLVISYVESKRIAKKITIKEFREQINAISLNQIFPVVLCLIAIIILLTITDRKNVISLYIYTSLSLLIILHTYWLSWRLRYQKRIVFLFFAFFIILGRILYPTVLSHDLFVVVSVVWLGAAIASFTFFTKKTFIIISLLWFLYDIFYVWITTGYKNLSAATTSVGFPLSLIVGHSSIGLADLLYASLLLGILQHTKYKILSIVLLLVNNVFLTIVAYTTNSLSVFPLLVLWVPCGLFVLIIDTLSSRVIQY